MISKDYRKWLMNCLSNRNIDIIKFYAVSSAWFVIYFNDYNKTDSKYDQDYAVNNGVIFG